MRVSYDGNVVLDGLDWRAERGEGWKICGKSGTGKTSLLKAVAGKIKFGGKVELKFYDDTEMPSEAYYVDNWYRFESLDGDKNFYYQQRYNKQEENETLTVYAELMRFGRERGLDYRRAEPLLEKFGFMDCRHRQLLELSSGEHKKLQLVCALWLRPQILLLDEPLTSLDVVVAEEMKQLLRSLKQDRITIFSTHIMDLALDLCDEIVLLHHGELEVVEKTDLDSKEFKDKIIAALREEGNE